MCTLIGSLKVQGAVVIIVDNKSFERVCTISGENHDLPLLLGLVLPWPEQECLISEEGSQESKGHISPSSTRGGLGWDTGSGYSPSHKAGDTDRSRLSRHGCSATGTGLINGEVLVQKFVEPFFFVLLILWRIAILQNGMGSRLSFGRRRGGVGSKLARPFNR
jgi:hypothetical protein